MEAAFIVGGLAGIGYVISKQQAKEGFSAGKPAAAAAAIRSLPHGNMAPYFRRDGTGGLSPDANVSVLDRYNGATDTYQHKQEVSHFGVVAANTTQSPFGMPNVSDFMHSRVNAPVKAEGTWAGQQVRVGPGIGKGYDWRPSEGFHQASTFDYVQPKDSDELRVADKVRKTYVTDMNPGHSRISEPMQRHEELPKNRPDRWWVNGPDRWNTTVGVEKGETMRHDMSATLPDQNRDTTDDMEGRITGPPVAAAAGYRSYIRPVLEPLMTFYKLTVGDYYGGGPGSRVSGPTLYDAWYRMTTNGNKEVLSKSRAPAAQGPKTFVGKDGVGKYDLNQDEGLRMAQRVGNAHRNNQQSSGRDGLGTTFFRPGLPEDAESRRLYDNAPAASLANNPFHVPLRADGFRHGN